jgi:membrane-bound lytic murein transglycosylase B
VPVLPPLARPRAARTRAVCAVVVSVWLWGVIGSTPLRAQTDAPAVVDPAPLVVPDPRIAPNLAAVAVDSAEHRSAVAHYRATEQRLNDARATFADAEATLGTLAVTDARLVATGNEARRKRDKAAVRVEALTADVRTFAVAAYIIGGVGDPIPTGLDLDEINERQRERVLADTVSEQQFVQLGAQREQQERMAALAGRTEAELAEVRRRTADTERTRDEASRDGTQAGAELLRATARVADARLQAQVVGLDFSLVVLDAYVKGAMAMAFEKPECGLRWTALAGIGRTESGHGTFGGAVVQPDGSLTRPIIGIPLDGSNETAVIGDSDGGGLDGDTGFDRAVGPMQFIPTSWKAFGRDGNGDRVADPQNMYDAALAAAVLLCRTRGIDADDAMRRAFLAYNNSNAYAALVLQRTHGYDAFQIPPVG